MPVLLSQASVQFEFVWLAAGRAALEAASAVWSRERVLIQGPTEESQDVLVEVGLGGGGAAAPAPAGPPPSPARPARQGSAGPRGSARLKFVFARKQA